jgi:hypothetical protein
VSAVKKAHRGLCGRQGSPWAFFFWVARRFPCRAHRGLSARGWQATTQGERLVQKELRKALLKYKLHTDQDLFDKAYGYIRQYY